MVPPNPETAAASSRPFPPRDYSRVLGKLPAPGSASQEGLMQAVCDALWDCFSDEGLSWIGFYTFSKSAPTEMTLSCRRNKPACSPIGLYGVCGQSWAARRPIIVRDVRTLGDNYVACDPRDMAEVVVPLLNPDGTCWAVLDGDSHSVNAFDTFDALALWRLVRHVGLSAHEHEDPQLVLVK